jgi:hypothetical protein
MYAEVRLHRQTGDPKIPPDVRAQIAINPIAGTRLRMMNQNVAQITTFSQDYNWHVLQL